MRASALLALLTAAAIGCDSTPPDNGGGWVATLGAPAGALDGAAVVELRGAGIQTVTATNGQLFTEATDSTVRVVVVRDTPGTISFNVQLERGSAMPRATVLEVADGNDVLRATPTQYSVRFAR